MSSRRLVHRALAKFDLPILSGANRGRKWRVGSGLLGCWIGTYEKNEIAIFEEAVKPGATVYDLGAHAGYFTLLASRRVGPTGRVIAVEPHPDNLRWLRHNLAINNVQNVTVVERAAADKDDQEVRLIADRAGFGYGGAMAKEGEFAVRTVTLDRLAESYAPPDVVKMDIEGAEAFALDGASGLLAGKRPTFFVSMHIHDEAVRVCEILRAADYHVYNIDEPSVPFATREKADYTGLFWVVVAVPAGTPVPRAGVWADAK